MKNILILGAGSLGNHEAIAELLMAHLTQQERGHEYNIIVVHDETEDLREPIQPSPESFRTALGAMLKPTNMDYIPETSGLSYLDGLEAAGILKRRPSQRKHTPKNIAPHKAYGI